MASKTKSFGILTSGGDCPGLNAAIRGVVKAAMGMGIERVVGFCNGYKGLIANDYQILTQAKVSGILTQGGTILGSSREKPFKADKNGQTNAEAGMSKPEAIIENYHKHNLDCLVVLGGNGTHKTAKMLMDEGLNVVGLPKTIDNDIWGTEITFGFQSAVDIATEAIDRLHSTALSHNRIMIIEVMGHKAGWLALYAGIAGGGDVILLPEIPYDISLVANHIQRRINNGKRFSIIVVAEGAVSKEEATQKAEGKKKKKKKKASPGKAFEIAQELTEKNDLDARVTVLGYQQRGGTPSPFDRVLSTQFGTAAAQLLYDGNYGNMVAVENGKITTKPIPEIAYKLKMVPANSHLVKTARLVDTCFGDE